MATLRVRVPLLPIMIEAAGIIRRVVCAAAGSSPALLRGLDWQAGNPLFDALAVMRCT